MLGLVAPTQIAVVPAILAVGKGLTVTVKDPVKFCKQTGADPISILTRLYVVFEVRFPVGRVAAPDEFRLINWFAPVPILYVTLPFGVPLNIILVPVPEQIGLVVLIDAVGLETNVTVPVAGRVGHNRTFREIASKKLPIVIFPPAAETDSKRKE